MADMLDLLRDLPGFKTLAPRPFWGDLSKVKLYSQYIEDVMNWVHNISEEFNSPEEDGPPESRPIFNIYLCTNPGEAEETVFKPYYFNLNTKALELASINSGSQVFSLPYDRYADYQLNENSDSARLIHTDKIFTHDHINQIFPFTMLLSYPVPRSTSSPFAQSYLFKRGEDLSLGSSFQLLNTDVIAGLSEATILGWEHIDGFDDRQFLYSRNTSPTSQLNATSLTSVPFSQIPDSVNVIQSIAFLRKEVPLPGGIASFNEGWNKSHGFVTNFTCTNMWRRIFSEGSSLGNLGTIALPYRIRKMSLEQGVPGAAIEMLRPVYPACVKTKNNNLMFIDCMRAKYDGVVTSKSYLGEYTILDREGNKFNFDKVAFCPWFGFLSCYSEYTGEGPSTQVHEALVFWNSEKAVITDQYLTPIDEIDLSGAGGVQDIFALQQGMEEDEDNSIYHMGYIDTNGIVRFYNRATSSVVEQPPKGVTTSDYENLAVDDYSTSFFDTDVNGFLDHAVTPLQNMARNKWCPGAFGTTISADDPVAIEHFHGVDGLLQFWQGDGWQALLPSERFSAQILDVDMTTSPPFIYKVKNSNANLGGYPGNGIQDIFGDKFVLDEEGAMYGFKAATNGGNASLIDSILLDTRLFNQSFPFEYLSGEQTRYLIFTSGGGLFEFEKSQYGTAGNGEPLFLTTTQGALMLSRNISLITPSKSANMTNPFLNAYTTFQYRNFLNYSIPASNVNFDKITLPGPLKFIGMDFEKLFEFESNDKLSTSDLSFAFCLRPKEILPRLRTNTHSSGSFYTLGRRIGVCQNATYKPTATVSDLTTHPTSATPGFLNPPFDQIGNPQIVLIGDPVATEKEYKDLVEKGSASQGLAETIEFPGIPNLYQTPDGTVHSTLSAAQAAVLDKEDKTITNVFSWSVGAPSGFVSFALNNPYSIILRASSKYHQPFFIEVEDGYLVHMPSCNKAKFTTYDGRQFFDKKSAEEHAQSLLDAATATNVKEDLDLIGKVTRSGRDDDMEETEFRKAKIQCKVWPRTLPASKNYGVDTFFPMFGNYNFSWDISDDFVTISPADSKTAPIRVTNFRTGTPTQRFFNAGTWREIPSSYKYPYFQKHGSYTFKYNRDDANPVTPQNERAGGFALTPIEFDEDGMNSITVEVWDVQGLPSDNIITFDPEATENDNRINIEIVGNSSYPHVWFSSDESVAKVVGGSADSRKASIIPVGEGTFHITVMDSAMIPLHTLNLTVQAN